MRVLACFSVMVLALGASALAASPTPARKAEAAIMAALSSGSGWTLPSRPRVVAENGGAYTLRAEGASYVLKNGLALDFEAIEAQVTPQPGGLLAVSMHLGGTVALRAPEGIWATLIPGKHRLTGQWDPARESFRTLEAGFAGSLSLANGAVVALEQADGRFSTADTGRLDGTVTLAGLKTDGARTADEVAVKFRLEESVLALDYRHSLPGGELPGIAGELLPLRLGLAAKVSAFQPEGVLSALAPWLVEVSRRLPPNAGFMWSSLWSHTVKALGASDAQVAVEKFDARSAALAAHGSGKVAFGPAGPRGTIDADLRGINERIAQLTPAERQQSPMLFPSLALMTVVGDGVTEGGKRFHRYRIELGDGGLKVNGRDGGGLKPKP